MKTSVPPGKAALLIISIILITVRISLYCSKMLHENHLLYLDTLSFQAPEPLVVAEPSFQSLTYLENPNSQSAVFIKTAVDDFNIKHTSSIKPPLPDLDIQKEKIVVNTSSGKQLTTKNKTDVVIPRYAFVDENGLPVEGNVEVEYREFFNPFEIFLSGIPMHYDSGGMQQLESAGMIEINAALNGREVFPNPDRLIKITFAQKAAADYNLYYFDQQNNEWGYMGKNQSQPDLIASNKTDVPAFKNMEFAPIIPEYHAQLKFKTKMSPHRSFIFGPKKKPDHFIFTFSKKGNIYSELKELKKVNWIYEGKDAPKVYKSLFRFSSHKNYAEQIVFYDSLHIDQTGSIYQMRFTNRGKEITLNVKPLIKNQNDQRIFDKSFSEYKSALETRYSIQNALSKKHKEDSALYDALGKFEINEEQNMLITLSVNKFGIWNCDRPFKPNLPIKVAAHFIDDAGHTIEIEKGWMVLKAKNTLIAVYDFNNFRFNPGSANIFWAVLPGNKIGIIYPEEFCSHPSGNRDVNFRITVYDTFEDGENALRKALSLRVLSS